MIHRHGTGVCYTNPPEGNKQDKHEFSGFIVSQFLSDTELNITAVIGLLLLESFRIERKMKSQLYLLATGGTLSFIWEGMLVGDISCLVQPYTLIIHDLKVDLWKFVLQKNKTPSHNYAMQRSNELKPAKTKMNFIRYKELDRTSQRTSCALIGKTNRWTMRRKIVMCNTLIQCELDTKLLKLNMAVPVITTRLFIIHFGTAVRP